MPNQETPSAGRVPDNAGELFVADAVREFRKVTKIVLVERS
jgi:hypothetical protein